MSAPILSNPQLFDMLRNGPLPASYSTFYEYLLVIHPGDEIGEKVVQLKIEMLADLYNNRSLHSKPHFTVANLLSPYCFEGRLLRALTMACAYTSPKWIGVDGLGNFPNGDGRNVIFIKTDEVDFFAELQARIKRTIRAEGIRLGNGIYSPNAHLTIAKDLSEAAFRAWWQTLGGEEYRRHFRAFQLVVLRRKLVPYAKYEELARLPFLGKAGGLIKPRVSQLRLF